MIKFSPGEVLEMAQQIERDGALFYRRAAENLTDRTMRQFLLRLAEMEDDHEVVFGQMLEELSAKQRRQSVFDADGEETLYLEAMVNGKVFTPGADPAGALRGDEGPKEVLEIAIGLEKDSILFYLGLKDAVLGKQSDERVDGIIKEEMRHISALSKQLAEMA